MMYACTCYMAEKYGIYIFTTNCYFITHANRSLDSTGLMHMKTSTVKAKEQYTYWARFGWKQPRLTPAVVWLSRT